MVSLVGHGFEYPKNGKTHAKRLLGSPRLPIFMANLAYSVLIGKKFEHISYSSPRFTEISGINPANFQLKSPCFLLKPSQTHFFTCFPPKKMSLNLWCCFNPPPLQASLSAASSCGSFSGGHTAQSRSSSWRRSGPPPLRDGPWIPGALGPWALGGPGPPKNRW